MPGVTVLAASTSMLGQQTAVSSENGNFRFPAVPPGSYSLTFELAGFNTMKREGIQITLGFTANVNVELSLATLQETVTVTGDSPIIDTSATRTVQTFKAEQLASIPNGRDLWSLLAVTPAVALSRIDVGGNRAGTQTGYTAYGLNGQVRVLVEGINTTEGTAASGVYFDYGSVEEAFLGTAGQSAEMPTPGVQSQFITRSGGNRFSGDFYQDWYNNSLQGSNLSDEVIAYGIREGSNEMQGYRDTALNFGGPIAKDKLWFHAAYRVQKNQVSQPNFRFDKTFDTELTNPSTKWTYQANENNKFIGYYQVGLKLQPNRLPVATYFYDNEGETWKQKNTAWVYKGEWNGTLSDKLYVEARYGDFGYFFPLLSNGDAQYSWRDTALGEIDGSYLHLADRSRSQADHRRSHLLRRQQQGQPHLQVRRRVAQGNGMGRLPGAGRPGSVRAVCADRSSVRQQRADQRCLPRADRDQSPRRLEGQRRWQHPVDCECHPDRTVRERHLGDGQADGQCRPPLRSLPQLHAGAIAAGVDDRPGVRAGAGVRGDDLRNVHVVCAAHWRHL